jgi:hypothetical protein
MKLTNDFFNKLAKELDTKYFADVKYYKDDKNCAKVHYAIELFNNGCLTYTALINCLSKNCKDSKDNIHAIVKNYVIFEGYEFKPK